MTDSARMIMNFYSRPYGHAFQVLKANEAQGSFTGKYLKADSSSPVDISGYFHFHKDKQLTTLNFTAQGFNFQLAAPYEKHAPAFKVWKGERIKADAPDSIEPVEFDPIEEVNHVYGIPAELHL
ncbi:hypothetical protein HU765_19960 [Pseudomonas sp. SWRI81]|uniref:hypothetical protein n=1 Tax=Pseudomonas sp. SWRI81 TaxID=2745505 RepID=UPI00164509A7|nr:hypothetical protein [Pseudomonas sp. SWRI81]MBC3272224.1 hypothetical protein [Pseudomonas sp. SWRI81]